MTVYRVMNQTLSSHVGMRKGCRIKLYSVKADFTTEKKKMGEMINYCSACRIYTQNFQSKTNHFVLFAQNT